METSPNAGVVAGQFRQLRPRLALRRVHRLLIRRQLVARIVGRLLRHGMRRHQRSQSVIGGLIRVHLLLLRRGVT